jgi:hypothetical protein
VECFDLRVDVLAVARELIHYIHQLTQDGPAYTARHGDRNQNGDQNRKGTADAKFLEQSDNRGE